MDVVDIGGASKYGRPSVPAMQTVVFSDEGERLVDQDGMVTEKTAPDDVRKDVEVPDRVKKVIEGGEAAAYPEQHPANDPNIELTPEGRIKLAKGQKLPGIGVGEKLGDVREGYKTGGAGIPAPAPAQLPAREAINSVEDHLALLEKQETMALTERAAVAKDGTGVPLVEVVFHTPVGAMVSYYHHVKQDGNLLILVVDNTQPAMQRFIPRPVEDGADNNRMDVTITGADKQERRLSVISLGIQFTMHTYDFVVLMIDDEDE